MEIGEAMDAKTTLPLAALCCAIALANPQPADAEAAAGTTPATVPIATAALPRGGARVSCTGCLSRPSRTHTVVVDTGRADGNGKTPAAGSATLRLPGFALDASGRRLDLELRLDVAGPGLADGDAVIDFTDPEGTGIILGNPGSAECATFTATARLLEAGTDLVERGDLKLAVERISTRRGETETESPGASHATTAPESPNAAAVAWSGRDLYRVAVDAAKAGGDEDERGDADSGREPDSDDAAENEDEDDLQEEADTACDPDGAGAETDNEDPDAPGRETESVAKTEPGTGADDPSAIDAGDLEPDRERCAAIVALDAPQELAAADYPVTSASSRRAATLALPKQFPLTLLPSGEVIAPTLLRAMGGSLAWLDITDIRVENRATDAKVCLSARDADGNLEEWFDGDAYRMGRHRIDLEEDVDFEVRLEGLSRAADGDLIDASVFGPQTLFSLVFEYIPVVPSS